MKRRRIAVRKICTEVCRGTSRGQTTVFLSLVLVLIVSLVCTLLEAARSEALRLRLQVTADASLSSAFAMYDRQVWDRYGLLMFADRKGDAGEFKETIERYAQLNACMPDGPGGDWTAFSGAEATDLKYVLMTDDHGEVFMQAVVTYMKECGLILEIRDLSETWDGVMDSVGAMSLINADGELDLDSIGSILENINDGIKDAVEIQTGGNGTPDGDDAAETSGDVSTAEALEIMEGMTQNLWNWKRRGLLMAVCDNVMQVSEKTISAEGLPSSLGDNERSRRAGEEMEHSLTDDLILREYALTHLNSYRDKPGEMLELEYLAAGKNSDLANLASVAKRLIAVRTALNVIFLETHSDYKAEITAVAAVIAVFAGGEGAIDGIRTILEVLWGLAEAVSDVRTLMSGGNVALIKGPEDWKLSLRNAALSGFGESADTGGMDYRDYMRLLLYIRSSETLAYRMMDCIQLYAQKKDVDFRMQDCIYAARVSLLGRSGPLFPFLPEEISYSLGADSSFSYGKISY